MKYHKFIIIIATAFFLLTLFFLQTNFADAVDGSGINSVLPASVNAGSAGNTLTFTFTAAEAMNSGEIALTVPTGWSAPQGSVGTAGYTTVTSSLGTIGTVLDNADSVTGWSAGTQCGNGLTSETTIKQEGTASISCSAPNTAVGAVFYKNITSQNWSGYTKVAFWIHSGKALAVGDLQFSYDDSANLASPIENISVPAYIFNSGWNYVVLNFGATTRTSVVSFGFRNNTGSGPLDFMTLRIDDLLLGPGLPTFPGGGIISARLLQLASGQGVTLTYGSGGGASGASAPALGETSTFTTKTRISDAGTLASIGASPTVTVIPTPTSTPTPTPTQTPTPTGESSSAPSGESGGGSPTIFIVSGQAYPKSSIEFLRKSALDERYQLLLETDSTISAGGAFRIQLTFLWQGDYLFALRAVDKDGRKTGLIAFDADLINHDKVEINDILVPPTIDFENAIVALGKEIKIMGYAAPLAKVEVEIDGIIKGETKSDANGFWSFTAGSASMRTGDHYARVRRAGMDGKVSEFSISRTFRTSLPVSANADLNNDNKVTLADWSIFLFRWGSPDVSLKAKLDMNGDGKININDFSIFLRSIIF
ncbi:MAG: hypothetical protein Q8P07_03425 [bacterium]|nr:hypothetical protein [bacterium]